MNINQNLLESFVKDVLGPDRKNMNTLIDHNDLKLSMPVTDIINDPDEDFKAFMNKFVLRNLLENENAISKCNCSQF